MSEARPLLEVRGLSVGFGAPGRAVPVVNGVDLTVARNEAVGLVGESGSGKSVTSLAVMGLTEMLGGTVLAGSVVFDGTDLTELSRRELSDLRGRRLSMIFQQPIRSLNPAFTVGNQIAETVRRHEGCRRSVAWRRAVDALGRVGIPRPDERAKQYPHELSGGMCQRVMIAMALACEPSLLIADEPTTALDVTVQKRILELLMQIQQESRLGLVLISHDLSVIAEVCDRVAVMYCGEVVEEGRVESVFVQPRHPYTAGLLGSVPRRGAGRRLAAIDGVVPSAQRLPAGCRFHPRCQHAEQGRCDQAPPLIVDGSRCVRRDELTLAGVRP